MKKRIKEQYAGLDVSLKSVSICVSDDNGKPLWRGEVENEASEVAQVLARRAPNLILAVLETGSCGIHLYRGLEAFGVPVVCACARHAKGALRCRVNKNDANDAEGLAHLAHTGWYREVYVKSAGSHEIRARAMLYEAANVLMVRVKADIPLKAWALKLADRVGGKKARVALARKMAIILHRMLVDNTAFRPV